MNGAEKQQGGLARSSPGPAQLVSLRAATPDDDEFLLAVFASTRSDELAGLAWDPSQTQAFIKMQFSAQSQSYRASYPSAENQIILLADQPIGRILVDRTGEEFVLVDIAILPEHRNRGVGSALMKDLVREAASRSKPVRLHVLNSSPALRLYERLGFSPISGDGVYLEMKWAG